jgi:hypothetical protein
MKRQKTIKVLDRPPTFILIDIDANEAEAKANWLKKYLSVNRTLSEEQQRREREMIRGGRVIQRKSYKK